jgi:hypothetical protein
MKWAMKPVLNWMNLTQEFADELGYEFESYEGESYESPLNELQELELATELLTVTNEAELDQFLGKFGKKLGGFVRKAWNSPVGGLLRKGLKTLAPIAGRVVGGMFGGPVGAQLGSKLAGGAVRLFRLELEGLSPEDQEFEIARAYVRFAGETARLAGQNLNKGLSPQKVVQSAMTTAARKHAPGLLETSNENLEFDNEFAAGGGRMAGPLSGLPSGGRWFRRGRRIFIEVGP